VAVTNETTSQALAATLEYAATNNNETAAALQAVFFYLSTGTQLIDFALSDTTNNSANPAFAGVQALVAETEPVEMTATSRTWMSLVEEIIPTQPDGYRDLWATVTFVADASDNSTILAVHEATNAIYEQAKAAVPDMDWIFFYQPWPRHVETYAAARGGNSLGLTDDHDRISKRISLSPFEASN
jgi:hypothetical protein